MISEIAGAAAGIHVILALVLTILALRAWIRVRAQRMLMLSVAFTAFLAQGIVLALYTLSDVLNENVAITMALVANAIALLAVYVGVSKP